MAKLGQLPHVKRELQRQKEEKQARLNQLAATFKALSTLRKAGWTAIVIEASTGLEVADLVAASKAVKFKVTMPGSATVTTDTAGLLRFASAKL